MVCVYEGGYFGMCIYGVGFLLGFLSKSVSQLTNGKPQRFTSHEISFFVRIVFVPAFLKSYLHLHSKLGQLIKVTKRKLRPKGVQMLKNNKRSLSQKASFSLMYSGFAPTCLARQARLVHRLGISEKNI